MIAYSTKESTKTSAPETPEPSLRCLDPNSPTRTITGSDYALARLSLGTGSQIVAYGPVRSNVARPPK
jgi:hypothetical protein